MPALLCPTVWHHAVQTREQLAAVWAHAGPTPALGLETDVRLYSGTLVLHHDPVPPGAAVDMRDHVAPAAEGAGLLPLTTLLAAVGQMRGAAVSVVVKLDVKEEAAAAALMAAMEGRPDAAPGAREAAAAIAELRHNGTQGDGHGDGRVEVWFNADLVELGGPCMYADPAAVLARAAPLFDAVSVGWGAPTAPYDDDAVRPMAALLDAAAAAAPAPFCRGLTFAVRLCLAEPPAAIEGLRALLSTAAPHCALPPTLTFWRARTEAITAAQTEWATTTFPGATVDAA